jgi:hypothetical protein
MWSAQTEKIAAGQGLRVRILLDGSIVSFTEVVDRWQSDGLFRGFFNGLLVDAPFEAFRWETPPIAAPTAIRPFEFVLLDSPELLRPADTGPFADHFRSGTAAKDVAVFANLGGDATLVVPCPRADLTVYAHLAAFARGAPVAQKHALWTLVGRTMAARIGPAPVWLSTAGAGVAWLHVRLDDSPKYYRYAPYRARPSAAEPDWSCRE